MQAPRVRIDHQARLFELLSIQARGIPRLDSLAKPSGWLGRCTTLSRRQFRSGIAVRFPPTPLSHAIIFAQARR